jgi:hypothetical protein
VRERLYLLGGQTLALGVMMAFLVVPASALFLAEYGASALPYAYLAVAVAGAGTTFAMTRAQRRLSLSSLATAVLGVYVVVVAGAWAVLAVSDGTWVTFPLLVLFPLSIPIGFALVGGQAGRLLDVRQMKAGFPRVAAGFSIGFALGGLGAAALVGPLGGPANLLAIDVLAALAMVGLVLVTSGRHPAELRSIPERPAVAAIQPAGAARWGLLRHRMVLLIFGYQVLSAAVTQLLDFMVWERAATRFPDPSDLARFQGLFGAVINVVSIAFVFALAGWFLTRFGIGAGLLANPVGVLVLLVVTTVTGVVTGVGSLGFFILICAQQVTDIALTDGTTRTSINATYQALLPHERLEAQTLVEGAGVPIALGVVGALLLVNDALDLGVAAVAVVALLLSAVWARAAVLAYREYGVSLRSVLARRAWDPTSLRMDDPASREAVAHLIASSDPHDVRTGLEALADADREGLAHQVSMLLDEGSDSGSGSGPGSGSGSGDRRRIGLTFLAGSDLERSPQLVGCVQRLLDDADPATRLLAAGLLVGDVGEVGERARRVWTTGASRSETLDLALEAAAVAPDRFFAETLMSLAGRPEAPGTLLDAMAANADHLLPLAAVLLDDPTASALTKGRVVHALGEAGTVRCRDLLLVQLVHADPVVVEAAAHALLGAQGEPVLPAHVPLHAALGQQAGRANRCLAVLATLDGRPAFEPLVGALRDELVSCTGLVEVLASIGHDPRAMQAGFAALADPDNRERSAALEMLEVTLGRSMSALVLAIVDPVLDDETRRGALDVVGTGSTSDAVGAGERSTWLRGLVRDDDHVWQAPWLRACALYALPDAVPHEAASLAAPWCDDRDAVVAETARWVTTAR